MVRETVLHPYFPRNVSLPHYKENVTGMGELLGIFFGLVAIVIVGLWILTRRKSTGVRLKICWFVSSGLIHIILEGYFVLFHSTLAGESTYLAQMWKEYGKGDSRYVTSDMCMVSMEAITTFVDGPLCLITASALFFPGLAHFRFLFQLAVSICQLYGDTLFFLTEIFAGFEHSEMWHPLHFWFYFFFLNIIWIIVPSVNIIDAAINIVRAQRTLDDSSRRTISNGKSKKRR